MKLLNNYKHYINLTETNIYVSKIIITGPDNGLSPYWRQPIIWTNAGILLIASLRTDFSEILIEIHIFSFKKTHYEDVVDRVISALMC